MTAAMLFEEALKLSKEEREELCYKLQRSVQSEREVIRLQSLEPRPESSGQSATRETLEARWRAKWSRQA